MIKGKARTRVNVSERDIRALEGSAGVQKHLYTKAVALNARALAIFVSQVRHTHPVTLPPYAASFKIRRARTGRPGWVAYNDDPAAFWVEWGAYRHHPTHPQILRYRPFGRALDALGAGA